MLFLLRIKYCLSFARIRDSILEMLDAGTDWINLA